MPSRRVLLKYNDWTLAEKRFKTLSKIQLLNLNLEGRSDGRVHIKNNNVSENQINKYLLKLLFFWLLLLKFRRSVIFSARYMVNIIICC